MIRQHSPDTIAAALSFIPSDDRDKWIEMGMAVKSELGDSGFDLWDNWSQGAYNYKERDAKSAWKSIKEGGRITIGTLFYEAKQRGFKLNGQGKSISPAEWERIRLEREERQRIEAAKKAKEEQAASVLAEQIYSAADAALPNHPYLVRKGVSPAHGIKVGLWYQVGADGKRFREKTDCLLVPMRDAEGRLWNLQAIFPERDPELERDKDYLLGGRKQGTYFSIGKPDQAVVIGEGLATMLSIRATTGLAVCVAFDKGNLLPVGKALREKLPDVRLIFAADNDIKEGKPNYGVEKSTAAASEVGGYIAIPELDGRKADFNDLHQAKGHDAVKAAIEGAQPVAAPKDQQEEGHTNMVSNLAVIERAQTGHHTEDKAEPRPLQRKPSVPTPFPIESLGDVLGGAARAMEEVIQAPLAICGNSVLAAGSLAVQGHANLLIDGRRHPLSEFFITIGQTGERKSAVDNIALWPHRRREEQLRAEYEQEFNEYQRCADAFKKSKEEAISSTKSKSYESKKKALSELGDPPQEPLKPLLICEEPTYEGLTLMLAHGQPSIGLFSDEGGRFIGGHGMNSDNALKTAAGMSGLWDGKPISRVRAGDGAVLLPGRRVSFHLMAQPDIAQLMLSNSVLIEQGLLSRCLVTWPTSTAGKRLYKEVDLSEQSAIKTYSAAMFRLLEAKLAMREGSRNELAPRDITLDHDAKQIWIAFHDTVEGQLVDGGELAQIRGLANKAPEHAARIAGILALVEDSSCVDISAECMEAGIALVTHYLNEAMRLYEAGIADPDIKDAEKLLAWAKGRQGKLISLVEMYQYGPSSVRVASRARHLIKILEEHGHAVPVQDERHKEVWRFL